MPESWKKSVSLQDAEKSNSSTWIKIVYFVMIVAEAFLFAGVLFGWSSLVYVYQKEGVYGHLCANNGTLDSVVKVPCPGQDNALNLAYSISSLMTNVVFAVAGLFFDTFGVLATRLLASCLFVPGCLMLAFVSKDIPWLIYPGLMMIASSHGFLITTNTKLTSLVGSKGSILKGCVVVGLHLSLWVFLLIKIAFEYGISYRSSLIFLACLWGIVIINSLVLFPKRHIEDQLNEGKGKSDTGDKNVKGIHIIHVNRDYVDNEDDHGLPPQIQPEKTDSSNGYGSVETPRLAEKSEERDYSLLQCVCSSENIIHTIWITFNFLRFTFFLGSLNAWLVRVTGGDDTLVNTYLSMLGVVQLTDIVFSPLSGLLIDWLTKMSDESTLLWRRSARFVLPTLLTSLVGALLSGVVLTGTAQPDLHAILVPLAFAIFSFFRSIFFVTCYSFCGVVYPGRHYGSMVGIGYCVAGLCSMFQFPLFVWSEENQLSANLLMFGLCILTLIHPAVLWIKPKLKKS